MTPTYSPRVLYNQLERKCTKKDSSVGGNVNRVAHRLHNITAYASVLSGTFSVQWDILVCCSLNKQKNCNHPFLRMTHTQAKKKFHWLLSLSLGDTASNGFEFELKIFSQQAYSLPVGDTKAKLDLFYPFFLTIQFAFFFGWLKVTSLIKILGLPSLNPRISINNKW